MVIISIVDVLWMVPDVWRMVPPFLIRTPPPSLTRSFFGAEIDFQKCYNTRPDTDTYVAIGGPERNGRIYVEDVGYQKSVIQELIRFNFPAKEVKVHGADKRARLMTVSHLVQNATVLFPKHGCEALISQMVNFGCEKHDDLVDAFSIPLTKIISRSHKRKRVGFSSLNIETGEWTECLVEVNDNDDD